ncbi:MAG: Ig-like domain-containing protein, partial [Bacteroidales bacterium]|nr:Ig-like domain-containing protein [Bacteroidales bacterium]
MTTFFAGCGPDEPENQNPPTPATVAVTGVTLNKSSMTLTEGGSETLTATVAPSNATNTSVSWSSSNTGVAT